jgi:hypothetical protein
LLFSTLTLRCLRCRFLCILSCMCKVALSCASWCLGICIINSEYLFLLVAHVSHPSTWGAEADDCKFKASLGYIARPCLKNKAKVNPWAWERDINYNSSESRLVLYKSWSAEPKNKSPKSHLCHSKHRVRLNLTQI